MLIALLFTLQVIGPPAAAAKRLSAARSCAAEGGQAGDVVVCGRPDQEQFRLRPLPDRTEPAVPRAETRVFGNVKAAADVEQAGVDGFPSNRIMLRLKFPF